MAQCSSPTTRQIRDAVGTLQQALAGGEFNREAVARCHAVLCEAVETARPPVEGWLRQYMTAFGDHSPTTLRAAVNTLAIEFKLPQQASMEPTFEQGTLF